MPCDWSIYNDCIQRLETYDKIGKIKKRLRLVGISKPHFVGIYELLLSLRPKLKIKCS